MKKRYSANNNGKKDEVALLIIVEADFKEALLVIKGDASS